VIYICCGIVFFYRSRLVAATLQAHTTSSGKCCANMPARHSCHLSSLAIRACRKAFYYNAAIAFRPFSSFPFNSHGKLVHCCLVAAK